MALTIETGAIVAGADSFATAAELATFAAAYGLTVPATAAEQEVLLRRAAVAMASLPWRGERVSAAQTLAWPRIGVSAHGFAVAATAVPAAIKQGQMALAAEIHADDLAPPDEKKGAITREKVDAIEVEYAQARASRAAPKRASVGHFMPYMTAGGAQVAVVRA